MAAKLIWEQDGKQEVLIKFSDTDLIALKNDLPGDEGVKDWFKQGPASQKVEKCKKRFIQEWYPRLFNDPGVETIPGTADSMIELVVKRGDYEDRIHRDARKSEEQQKALREKARSKG